MTDEASELPSELTALDPVLGDPPPRPGSSRYDSILERAMHTTETTIDSATKDPSGPHRSRRVWAVRVLVAAAAIVVLAVGALVAGSIGKAKPASAAEQVAAAARTTGDLASLRIHGVYTDTLGDGNKLVRTLDAEVDGTDVHMATKATGTPGRPSSTSSFTVIGDRAWETSDGKTTERPAGPASERNAPFPIASRAVVTAALKGSVVKDLGGQQVRGEQATHYRITLTAASRRALGGLPANQLSAFELEYPQGVDTFDVWVADDLIHKISVGSTWAKAPSSGDANTTIAATSVVEFYDFGSDITITPPR